jgi:DNA-damage-inducible protein J
MKGDSFMTTSNINMRVDSKIKEQAEALFSKLGLNMSTAINVFLRQAIQFGGIPFEVRIIEPNEATLQAMQDVDNNKNLSQPLNSINALFEELDA